MSQAVKIPDTVYETAEEVQEIHDYATLGEAVRHICQESGYDV